MQDVSYNMHSALQTVTLAHACSQYVFVRPSP